MTGHRHLFETYAPILRGLGVSDLEREIEAPDRLLIASSLGRTRAIDIAYAPFDYLNPTARVVIVGMTPGRRQMGNALHEAHRQIQAGASSIEVLRAAKKFASFSGPIRANLVAMLDHVGLHRYLGLATTASLWDADNDLIHLTSALRYPVFVNGSNYSGAPSMVGTPQLSEQLALWFGSEIGALRHALFIPLGSRVAEAVHHAARDAAIDPQRILDGLPHPSGANAERVAFFLDRKPRRDLSPNIAADALLEGRARVRRQLSGAPG